MKFFTIAFASAVAGLVLLSGGGCSSETDTKQPKVQGPVDNRLKGGPVGRSAPGGPGGKPAGGAPTASGGLSKN